MHNLCCDNCHSHVACALNNFKYKGSASHSMISIWLLTICQSKYLG